MTTLFFIWAIAGTVVVFFLIAGAAKARREAIRKAVVSRVSGLAHTITLPAVDKVVMGQAIDLAKLGGEATIMFDGKGWRVVSQTEFRGLGDLKPSDKAAFNVREFWHDEPKPKRRRPSFIRAMDDAADRGDTNFGAAHWISKE